jgi:adenosylmethionine-8-amino-7-oxononanoate aminotransferase
MDIAENHGLFVRAVGDTIVIAPPLITTKGEINELARRLTVSLLETETAVRNS